MINPPTPSPSSLPADRRDLPARSALRRLATVALIAVVLGLLATCVVTVDETEFVIVERLGRIAAVYDRPEDRGLHFKLPWPIDAARRFDRRVQLFNPPAREVFTRDRKNVLVGTYVCWRIAEPASAGQPLEERPVVRFYRGLGSLDVAEARLESRSRAVLGTQVGQVELGDLLRAGGSDSDPGPEESEPAVLERLADAVRREISRAGEGDLALTDRLGIELVDLRINRLGFPAGNQQAIFERMRSERKKIADSYRSAGMAENKMIMSQADRQYGEILARAQADAERIRGEAEAESIAILNRAHARDPEFYRITRTLDAYREILGEKTTLVLSASNSWLKLLTDGLPETPLPARAPGASGLSAEEGPARAEHPNDVPLPLPATAARAPGLDIVREGVAGSEPSGDGPAERFKRRPERGLRKASDPATRPLDGEGGSP